MALLDSSPPKRPKLSLNIVKVTLGQLDNPICTCNNQRRKYVRCQLQKCFGLVTHMWYVVGLEVRGEDTHSIQESLGLL